MTGVATGESVFNPYDETDPAQNPPPNALVSVGELEGTDLPDPADTDLTSSGVLLPPEEG